MGKNSLIKGAFILTFAGIITRILGFIYRVYMTNVMGSECVGLYQLIMPIYTLAWSISCAGITTTISKLVAQEKAKNQWGNVRQIFKQCVIIAALLGLFLNIILYFGAEKIAKIFFSDIRLILPLKILSFSFLFMSVGSCIRGYFFGLQKSFVPAISQILEQIVHVCVVYFFIIKFINSKIEYMCSVAVSGMTFGELISFTYVYLAYKNFFLKSKVNKKINKINKKDKQTLSFFSSLRLIFSMAIPLTANRVIASLLVAIENILIPQRLLLNKFSRENAISLYGQVTGMAIPLIYFPSVFLISLAISLVPEVSQAHAKKNKNKINYTISKTILLTSIIGIGAAIFFILFAKEIGFFIYHKDISKILRLLGFMCPFIYLQIVLSGILNGLGFQVFIFKINLLSSLINLFFIYFIIPYKGIYAFIVGWFMSLIISCLLILNIITKYIDIKLEFDKLIFKPIVSIVLAGFISRFIADKFIFVNLKNIFGLFLSALILGFVYIFFIVISGCISIKELKNLIFINKNYKIKSQ